MYYPLVDTQSRAIYRHNKSNNTICANYDIERNIYSPVKLPQFNDKKSSIWGIETPINMNMFSIDKPKIHCEGESIIMNVVCPNMGHYLAIFYKYAYYISPTVKICVYEDMLPENIKLILKHVYPTQVIYLTSNTIYTFAKLHILFTVSDNSTFLYYDNSVYVCRQQIISYMDSSYINNKSYDKIIIAKTLDHSTKTGFSKNGLVNNTLLSEYINAGYFPIDTYNTNILDVIYYLRHANEIIISYGTTLYCHMPYFKKNTKVTVLFNTEYINEIGNIIPYNIYMQMFKNNKFDQQICTLPTASEYCSGSMYYLIFLEKTNYKIGFIDANTIAIDNITYITC